MSKKLKLLISGQVAGDLKQAEDGRLSFQYDETYSSVPLSPNMSVFNHLYEDKLVRPFLFGLLPDDPSVRRSMGREYGVSGENPFALLHHVGLDCPGAVQICGEEDLRKVLTRPEKLVPISAPEIAIRLRRGREVRSMSWMDENEHWSLGGQQSKFALRKQDGTWWRCEGAAATTHILKGGIQGLRLQALNEYLCLKLASACGIPSANVEFINFDGENAIVIERFDRYRDSEGHVHRIHQIDLCQALGVLPQNKYPQDGGPSTPDVVNLLKKTGKLASRNIELFTAMLFFNYLIEAPDAHAKNYSLIPNAQNDYMLAPLYDVASMAPYTRPRERLRTAMNIGGENRIGHVGKHAIDEYVKKNQLENVGMGTENAIYIMQTLAEDILDNIEDVFDEADAISDVSELRSRMVEPIMKLCELTLAKVS